MDSSGVMLIFILIVAVGFLMAMGVFKKTEEPQAMDKILDYQITTQIVVDYLGAFKPTLIEGRKNGFTEKDIHDQLEKYLKKYFFSVTREHAIDGKNVKRIDFDIGNGGAGVEVKLAESLLKEREGDRLIGQLQKYKNRKYDNENLIIVVAGFDHHLENTVIHDTRNDVTSNGAWFVFLEAKNK